MNGIHDQYQSIRQTWGEAAANRYLSLYQQREMLDPMPTKRHISNTEHQPKLFNPLEAAVIALQKDAGGTCRKLAQEWGCSQGTISAIGNRGAYKPKRNNSTFDY